MTCKNCGENLPENVTLCPKCGADNNETAEMSAVEGERTVPRGFSSKKNIIIIIVAAVLLIIGSVTAIAVTNYNSVSNRATRGIELAERYLNEQNYEQAIIEFQKVLKIEPMNVDAYLGLADVYEEMGDIDKATEILQDGLEKTGDERIQQRLDELLKQEEESTDTSVESEPAESETTASMLAESEATESEPVYGSMGSVMIAGTEVDIATTKNLFIYNKERYEENWDTDDISQRESGFDCVIYLTSSLSDDDLNSISKLINLQKLRIACADIFDIAPLAVLINLTYLDLYDNQISDITPLSNLTNLQSLYLWYNQISDIMPLADLTNLTDLYLFDNQISDITPLDNLINLEFLDLGYNQISDIVTIDNFTNLRYLNLCDNQISDITSLANLTSLTHLVLSDNQIRDIMLLSNITNLTILDLGGNQISDITPLANLTNLTHLGLDGNQIRDITPLVNLTNLQSLYLLGNLISEEDIAWLENKLPNCVIYG